MTDIIYDREDYKHIMARSLDHPSVYMGGPSRHNLNRAEELCKLAVDPLLKRLEALQTKFDVLEKEKNTWTKLYEDALIEIRDLNAECRELSSQLRDAYVNLDDRNQRETW